MKIWDKIVKIILDVGKVLAVVAPTALVIGTYVEREVIFKSVANYLEPIVTNYIDEVVPAAVYLAVQTTEIQTKLDSMQMNALENMMIEHQEATLDAIPGEVRKEGKKFETKILTRKYKVHDARTGLHIQNLVGVKQSGGEWFIYLENIER